MKCDKCKREIGGDFHVVDYGNWNIPNQKGMARICDYCDKIWTELFRKTFGDSVSSDKYHICRQLFQDFLNKKGTVFIFR